MAHTRSKEGKDGMGKKGQEYGREGVDKDNLVR